MRSLTIGALLLLSLAAQADVKGFKKRSSIKVAGTPSDARVIVTGPDGFVGRGGIPWEVEGIQPGTYFVRITSDGHLASDKALQLKAGETATIPVALEPIAEILGPGGIGTGVTGGISPSPSPKPVCVDGTGGAQKGTVQFVPGNVHVIGGLTADEVERIVRRHWAEVRSCYLQGLESDPELAGKVAIGFQIGPIGDIVTAAVRETDLHNDHVEECVLAKVRLWKFPNPRGGGVVDATYPFIFQLTK